MSHTVRKFADTDAARAATVFALGVDSGDVIYVPSEGVVGMAHGAFAYAITSKSGQLTDGSDGLARGVLATEHGEAYSEARKLATVLERVERGASWLDVHVPGWHKDIKDSLSNEVAGEWDVIWSATNGRESWEKIEESHGHYWMLLRGFTARDSVHFGPKYVYADMTPMWRDLIAIRRERTNGALLTASLVPVHPAWCVCGHEGCQGQRESL